VDAFGTDEVTFITLLKGNWFLGHLLLHKLLSLDRCPVSGSLVGVSRWLPMDGVGALGSVLQARKQMCSYLLLPLVRTCSTPRIWFRLLVLELCSENSHSLSKDQAGQNGVHHKYLQPHETVLPLIQCFPWSLQPPQIFRLVSNQPMNPPA
jgi:hypothetical protein